MTHFDPDQTWTKGQVHRSNTLFLQAVGTETQAPAKPPEGSAQHNKHIGIGGAPLRDETRT